MLSTSVDHTHLSTPFSVYDKQRHLCAFDSGLVERNVELYFSGVVKPIYDENPDPADGIQSKQLGPINSWWIAGFDGGSHALIGFTTAYAEYILMEPSPEYRGIMATVHEKIHLSKVCVCVCVLWVLLLLCGEYHKFATGIL